MGCQNSERVKCKSRNPTWCLCSRQVCNGLEIQCVCWACSKVFINNILFLPKTRRNDNRENNWRDNTPRTLGKVERNVLRKYIFRSPDEDMNSKLPILIGKSMQEYQKAVNEEKEKQAKKEKQIKKKNTKKVTQGNSL